MWLGLDVGGTHTDAVVVDENGIVATAKVVTDHANLIQSVQKAFEQIFRSYPSDEVKKKLKRINLSTTLSTNAIVEGKTENVGVIVSSGPGIHPSHFKIEQHYFPISGSIDHRGKEISKLNAEELRKAIDACKKDGIKVFSAVTKFSTRNPSHEEQIRDACADADFVTLGHRISGKLGFPRRIGTAYLNSAVWRLFNAFADAIEKNLVSMEIHCPVHILKADGGTIPLAEARKLPVESILSGPAASTMGISSLCRIAGDAVALDIGGTTTDISVFADGEPLIEPHGITVGKFPTLVRSLYTRSIGIGGDSAIVAIDGKVQVGPTRYGPSMAEGGDVPTLLDAMNYLKKISHGDVDLSVRGIERLAKEARISAKQLSLMAIDFAFTTIKEAVDALLKEVNEKPVYTIHEMIEGKVVQPTSVYAMGGPSRAFLPLLEEKFALPVHVPNNYAVANAIGAALARTTYEIELHADTERGKLSIPNIGKFESCERNYSIENAKIDLINHLLSHLQSIGISITESDVQIVEASSFNIVSGFYTSGKNIRARAQVKPAVEITLYSRNNA
ncbi:MAG: hydantoinase/oxoprolinase family protein [Spirochaetes bacterium]|nr:hydantoinase/oxoprolinase family protein [Spirochaetota bacterium]